jgi:hypothetical protein
MERKPTAETVAKTKLQYDVSTAPPVATNDGSKRQLFHNQHNFWAFLIFSYNTVCTNVD